MNGMWGEARGDVRAVAPCKDTDEFRSADERGAGTTSMRAEPGAGKQEETPMIHLGARLNLFGTERRTSRDLASRRRAARRLRPSADALEGRLVLSTMSIAVTNADNSGAGSLRAAIVQADGVPAGTAVEIDFNVPTGGASAYLVPFSQLPAITRPLTINGASQPVNFGDASDENVLLDGSGVPGADGLVFTSGASGSVVEGLSVTGFGGVGLHFEGASNVQVVHDTVGFFIYPDGASLYIAPNDYGVEFDGGSGETIANDAISGNTIDGLRLIGTSGSLVANDSIGYDADSPGGYDSGGSSIGNGGVDHYGSGVYVDNGADNTVTNCVISNNGTYGIQFAGPGSQGNQLNDSKIGTDASGYFVQPNGTGLSILGGASGNTASSDEISGNSWDGVSITDPGTVDNELYNDVIGLSGDMTTKVPNWNGVQIIGGSGDNVVYQSTISGNQSDGIFLEQTQYNDIQDDQIGLGLYGTPVGNGAYGIILVDGTSGNTVYDDNIEFNSGGGLATFGAWWDNGYYDNTIVNNGGWDIFPG